MSVVSIIEIFKGRGGDGTLTETQYVRVLRVVTDDGTDGPDVVLAAVALTPWFIYGGAAYPTDAGFRCISARPNNDVSPKHWLVTATYSNKFDWQENPVNDEITIDWDEEDFQKPVTKDRNGQAVVNSAGFPPVEPLMADDGHRIVTIKANVSSRPAYSVSYRRAINSASFTIDGELIAAKYAQVRRISCSWWKYRGSSAYREITLQLSIRNSSDTDFELYWLDQGFRRVPTAAEISAGTYVAGDRPRITDVHGVEVTDPVLLDGSGNPLSNPSASTAVFIQTPYYPLKTFAGVLPGCT